MVKMTMLFWSFSSSLCQATRSFFAFLLPLVKMVLFQLMVLPSSFSHKVPSIPKKLKVESSFDDMNDDNPIFDVSPTSTKPRGGEQIHSQF